ncbi:hypothetical protein VTI74DRAFT_9934 [Chaetomium olivicolor]
MLRRLYPPQMLQLWALLASFLCLWPYLTATRSRTTGVFSFEIKRSLDFTQTSKKPQLINLQWVDGTHFKEDMWNNGTYKVENPGHPVCPFEVSAAKAPPPAKTLNAVDDLVPTSNPPRKITQRNCQTWVIEAAEKLVRDGMLDQAALDYLRAKKQ